MQRSFKEGQRIITKSRKTISIIKFLGSGGQGEVFEVLVDSRKFALKWYFIQTGTEKQKKTIENLVKTGRPDERFLWPTELIEISSRKSFGYLMPLRPPQFSNIVDLMKRRIEPTFDAVIMACIQLSDSFNKLHQKKLCYRDISFGNFFFHGKTGDVLICDNDNVTHVDETHAGVLGTPRFMAPEVVRGATKPNLKTDLFSLSVLIFYMLMMHHPLEGKKEKSIKCFDLPAMTRLYGEDPIFIFNPQNNNNRPIPGCHDNAIAFWPIYTERIRNLFTQTFVMGAHHPTKRVAETVWREALIELKNSIVICSCGMENFYDIYKLINNQTNKCWSCRQILVPASRLRINNEIVVLNLNTKLYGHHLIKSEKFIFKRILGEVIPHPKIKALMGLKNLGQIPWEIENSEGKKYRIDFGKSFTIEDGTKIYFGEVEGNIRKG